MTGPLLLIDTNYLCHRAFHAIGDLTHGEVGVGAIFGVLRDVVLLQEQFQTTRCAFAFDPGGRTKRHELHPGYKASRTKRHEDEDDTTKAARRDFYRQVDALRDEYLPAAGFLNVFHAPGYEGDDIIAQLAAGVQPGDEAVIVSADKDLYQCLRREVWLWNPHKKQGYNHNAFAAEWGLEPHRWPEVKAYAGDAGDDIPGLQGIGEKTAAKYLRGLLGAHTKAHAKLRAGQATYHANLPLVRLPMPGTPEFELRDDEVTEERWQALADRLGMRSLRGDVPRAATRKSRGRKRGQEGFGFDS